MLYLLVFGAETFLFDRGRMMLGVGKHTKTVDNGTVSYVHGTASMGGTEIFFKLIKLIKASYTEL